MFVVGVNENHTVALRPPQATDGSSGATVAVAVLCVAVNGMDGTTVAAPMSSFAGGGGATVMVVKTVSTPPCPLFPVNPTVNTPSWSPVGVQLNVPVLTPLSTNVAPAGSPLAARLTCRPRLSTALTANVRFCPGEATSWRGAVSSTTSVA